MSDSPTVRQAPDSAGSPQAAPSRFAALPPRITLEETVESHPSARPADPDFGRDPDTDWLIRYCA